MAYQRFLGFGYGRTNYMAQAEAQAILDSANPLLWHAIMWPWDDFQASRRDDHRFRFEEAKRLFQRAAPQEEKAVEERRFTVIPKPDQAGKQDAS